MREKWRPTCKEVVQHIGKTPSQDKGLCYFLTIFHYGERKFPYPTHICAYDFRTKDGGGSIDLKTVPLTKKLWFLLNIMFPKRDSKEWDADRQTRVGNFIVSLIEGGKAAAC